jgi:hypothetical protein
MTTRKHQEFVNHGAVHYWWFRKYAAPVRASKQHVCVLVFLLLLPCGRLFQL